MPVTQLTLLGTPGQPYGSFVRTHSPVTCVWIGGAVTIAQVKQFLFGGSWLPADNLYVKYGNKTLTVAAGSAAIANILTLLQTVYNGLSSSQWPEYTEQTASSAGSNFILTADNPGKPFALTISTDSADGTIDGGTFSAGNDTILNSGPNDISVAANWSTDTTPQTGDTMIIALDGAQIWYGLGMGITPARVDVLFRTGELGLPLTDTDGNEYPQYRTPYLTFNGATLANINSAQSGRIKMDFGAGATVLNGLGTGTGEEQDIPAALLLGTSVTANFSAGDYGVAFLPGETATYAVTNRGATVTTGSGCTITTGNQAAGTTRAAGPVSTSWTQTGGTTIFTGVGANAALNVNGGRATWSSTGVLGPVNIGGNGYIDFSQDLQPKVVGLITINGPSAGGSDAAGSIVRPYVINFLNGSGRANWVYGPAFKTTVANAP